MDSLRRRIPFKLVEDDEDHNISNIYDEQRVFNHFPVKTLSLICINNQSKNS